jgi:hypothetical protein
MPNILAVRLNKSCTNGFHIESPAVFPFYVSSKIKLSTNQLSLGGTIHWLYSKSGDFVGIAIKIVYILLF